MNSQITGIRIRSPCKPRGFLHQVPALVVCAFKTELPPRALGLEVAMQQQGDENSVDEIPYRLCAGQVCPFGGPAKKNRQTGLAAF